MEHEGDVSNPGSLDGDGSGARRPWAALTIPSYRLLWISLLFSSLALQMARIVNLLQVYELSQSALQLGLTGLAQAAPLFALGLFGGTVADAVNRRLLLVISQGLTLLFVLALGLLTASGAIQVWHIYAVTAAISAVSIFDRPARMSIIPGLVPRSYLMNAVTLHTTVMQLSMLFGPLLGGVIIAALGFAWAYFAMVIAFLPVMGTLAVLKVVAECYW